MAYILFIITLTFYFANHNVWFCCFLSRCSSKMELDDMTRLSSATDTHFESCTTEVLPLNKDNVLQNNPKEQAGRSAKKHVLVKFGNPYITK